jgi:hypothetical protein
LQERYVQSKKVGVFQKGGMKASFDDALVLEGFFDIKQNMTFP